MVKLFRIRERSSGYYLAWGTGGVEDRPGFRMIRDHRFAMMLQGDPDDADVKRGIASAYEWFGESPRNGFELYPEPIDPGQASLEI